MKRDKDYRHRVVSNLVGMGIGLSSLVFSAVSDQFINIGIKTNGFFGIVGFMIVMYYGIWNLKCPYCSQSIDVRGALYICHCPKCGEKLK